ncbi:MotA/TolQ/ExbB proton channel family protein [bacterium]|nr:MotA/TolQ/ExbB proton channel family protein [bacterium]
MFPLLALEAFVKGGPILFLLLALSLIALTLVIAANKALALVPPSSKDYVNRLMTALDLEDTHDVKVFLNSRSDPYASVLKVLLGNQEKSREIALEAATQEGIAQVNNLRKHNMVLASIATSAPLLGLLGTIMGLISVFNVISSTGLADNTALAGGIAEALLTSFGGLLVGIIFLFLLQVIRKKIENIEIKIERAFVDVLSHPKFFSRGGEEEEA